MHRQPHCRQGMIRLSILVLLVTGYSYGQTVNGPVVPEPPALLEIPPPAARRYPPALSESLNRTKTTVRLASQSQTASPAPTITAFSPVTPITPITPIPPLESIQPVAPAATVAPSLPATGLGYSAPTVVGTAPAGSYTTRSYSLAPPVVQTTVGPPVISPAPVTVTRYAAQPPIITGYAPTVPGPNTVCFSQPSVPVVTTYYSAAPTTVLRPAVPAAVPVTAVPTGYYMGRGLIGQPKVYVSGQPVRNALRYISP